MSYFKGIRGQDQSIEAIKKAIQEEHISHAYLFMGPFGVGKMATARAFASCILAKGDRQADILLEQNMHPDLLIIEKDENKTLIGIEQITRQMEPWLATKPFRSSSRVVIIRDAQLLSEPAANSLLKILEDPPRYAVIILIADLASIMETILSRCQVVRFLSLSEQTISDLLVENGVGEGSAKWAAQMGQGSIGRAWSFVTEEGLIPLWDQAQRMVRELAAKTPGQIFKTIDNMEKYPEMTGALLESILRDVCVYKLTGQPEFLIFKDNINLAEYMPSRVKPEQIMNRLENIAQMRRLYSQNINPLLLNIHVAYAVHEALQ